MGVTEDVLKVDGTMPDSELIMSTMRGHRAGREDFPRVVGHGVQRAGGSFGLGDQLSNRNRVHRREGGERVLGQGNSLRISCPCLR